ncbi:MAG: hypothetical protein ABI613_00485 [Gemmatimonadota bacterium]
MRKEALTLVAFALVAGCARKDRADMATADSLSRDLELAPAESSATLNDRPATPQEQARVAPPQTTELPPVQTQTKPKPSTSRPTTPVAETTPASTPAEVPTRPSVAPAPMTLPAGTAISGSVRDSLSSRRNKPGETVTATISTDIRDQNGRVIIPAGSIATFSITALAPAENKSATDGTIALSLSSVNVGGRDYPITGSVQTIEHSLKGRGVTTGDAAKVGAGAAAGAIAGRILGGKRGTVIGGVVGAAVGTGVAVESADRDVVVPVGGAISFTLGEELVVSNIP